MTFKHDSLTFHYVSSDSDISFANAYYKGGVVVGFCIETRS